MRSSILGGSGARDLPKKRTTPVQDPCKIGEKNRIKVIIVCMCYNLDADVFPCETLPDSKPINFARCQIPRSSHYTHNGSILSPLKADSEI